jgi:hypothetical protein
MTNNSVRILRGAAHIFLKNDGHDRAMGTATATVMPGVQKQMHDWLDIHRIMHIPLKDARDLGTNKLNGNTARKSISIIPRA